MGNESDSRNPFGERCHIRLYRFQITCAHDGCNAKVHRECQRHWITLAQLPHIESIPTYCPTHNRQRGDYIAWYYESKKQPIPDSLTITTSKDVGESNQGHITPYMARQLAITVGPLPHGYMRSVPLPRQTDWRATSDHEEHSTSTETINIEPIN